jgi:hypothetical protein
MNRRTCSPPASLKQPNGLPHLVVASMMRSGTHIAIDLLLNNFSQYKGSPLYVNLDMVLHFGGKMDDLSKSGGSVIKTHFPQAIECRGHKAEISNFLTQQKVILVTRDPQQIKQSLRNFGEWGAEEALKFDPLHQEFENYWLNEHKGEVMRVDYMDLIQPDKVPEILRKIESFSGLEKNAKFIGVICKKKRVTIFLCKALTRVFGRFAPRINTGIKLGKGNTSSKTKQMAHRFCLFWV